MAYQGFWKLISDSSDYSGNAFNGTDTSVTYINGGPLGKHARFGTSSNRIKITRNASLEPSTNGSVCCLFYRDSGTSLNQVIFGINNVINVDRYGYAMWYYYPSNQVCYEYDNASTFNQHFQAASRDAWYLSKIKWDGTTLYRVLNGVTVSSVGLPFSIAYNSQPLMIGGDDTNPTGRYLLGGVSRAYVDNTTHSAAFDKNEWASLKGFF